MGLQKRDASGRPASLALRSLSFLHRWLGVGACLLCVMWFASGLVMMYVPFPAWTDNERLATLKPLDAPRITITPGKAFERANARGMLSVFRLEMWGDEPVYRIANFAKAVAVSAVDARVITEVGIDEANAHLVKIFPESKIAFQDSIERDQWTVTSTFNAHRPIYLFSLGDSSGTQIYVSSHTGEIVQKTTRSSRLWNWLGSVPHWIYFTAIRSDGEVWRQVVMWVSGPVIVLAVAGMWLGVLRLRPRRRYSGGRMTPFQSWMKWHHLLGLIGGFFLTTWIATGWLSVGPFGLFSSLPPLFGNIQNYYGDRPESFRLSTEQLRNLIKERTQEISFSWLANEPLAVVNNGTQRITASGKDGSLIDLGDDQLVSAAGRLLPDNQIVLHDRLQQEDLYWYSHRIFRQLPVLRVGFDDPGSTWVHLDPANGKILSIEDRSQRTYRWVFNLLHDFDLPILLHNRPLWDLLMWVLILAGLALSITGTVVGWRAVVRMIGKAAHLRE